MVTSLAVVASGYELSMTSLPSELVVVVPLSALCGGDSDTITHRQTAPAEDTEPTWEDAEWL
jgi:hypothetical protein